jgi:toxin CcdB
VPTLSQFDVFENPSPRARRDYPFLVIIQSNQADTGRMRVVAPLVRCDRGPDPPTGRLVPVAEIDGQEHAVLVPRLTTIDTTPLGRTVASLESCREAILSAVDLLIFGV